MNNEILSVVTRMGTLVLIFVPVIIAVIEYVKASVKFKGQKAQWLASGISLIFGLMIVVVYVWPETTKYIGIVMFLVVMAMAPSGGFKLLERFTSLAMKE